MKNAIQLGSVDHLLCNPKLHDLLTVVKAARNGVVFGAKVRFPHALVNVMMYGKGSLISRLLVIMQLTRSHAKTLAMYAAAYKAVMILLRNTFSQGVELSNYSTIAGGLAGAIVFGSRTPINEQLVLYAFSRGISSLIIPRVKKVIQTQREKAAKSSSLASCSIFNKGDMTFRLFAAFSWAVAMRIYTHDPARLGQSVVGTMDYLYASCEKWDGLRTFVSF